MLALKSETDFKANRNSKSEKVNNVAFDYINSDKWDFRKIAGATYHDYKREYTLNFSDFKKSEIKEIVKKYIKMQITSNVLNTLRNKLGHIKKFDRFMQENQMCYKNINQDIIQNYYALLLDQNTNRKEANRKYMAIKSFLEYCEFSNSIKFNNTINNIFSNTGYKKRTSSNNSINAYISEDIIAQLVKNIDLLTPQKYAPVVILMIASGWRISDILNLKYDNCLTVQADCYYLQGDIKKTDILEHRIPIEKDIAELLKIAISEIKSKSDTITNPNKYLFAITNGKNMGSPYSAKPIREALNKLSIKVPILDQDGNIFKFKPHSFRHTKAVELINNGMNLVHVQKWLAHQTPIMTLHYAKILDQTMRKSWEEAIRDGLFKLDGTGNAAKIDITDIQDEDIIEWEWIKHNLDAVRMPLGYCMKPNKMECATQLNPCLTCRSLCTTPEFIPAFEQEIMQTKEIIDKGKSQNRTFWVEKNELLLDKLQSVLAVLKSGKINHGAGKQGREYVGEQRK